MTRRNKVWLAVASIFTLVNIGGAVFVLRSTPLDVLHAMTHVALGLAGTIWVAWLARRTEPAGRVEADVETQQRLEVLQQSVDAIALEVERIGEAQRFTAKVTAQRVGRGEGGGAGTV